MGDGVGDSMSIWIFFLCIGLAYVAGIFAGIHHSENSICDTIERIGYRTISKRGRIVGHVEKGNLNETH